jgi:hypothetical protein
MEQRRIGEWESEPILVGARLVPRYLWTTASIDVFVGSQRVLATGGRMKVAATCTAEFNAGGSIHRVALAWSAPQQGSFPIEVTIDGRLVANTFVHLRRWYLAAWPLVVLSAAAAFAMFRSGGHWRFR